MTCPQCDQEECLCQSIQVIRSTEAEKPKETMTKQQFGEYLYEAICLCSQAQQLLRYISQAVEKKKDSNDLAAQYQRVKKDAQAMCSSPDIADADAARLLNTYPWLAH